MATNLIRKQVAPSATSQTEIYTVPAGTKTVISTVLVCNRGATDALFRISNRALGAVLANSHYLYYDNIIPAYTTFTATLGQVVIATDVVEVYASTGNLSFHLSGQENT